MNLEEMVRLPADNCLRVCARAVSNMKGDSVSESLSDGALFVTKRVATILGAIDFVPDSLWGFVAVFPENCGWFRDDLK